MSGPECLSQGSLQSLRCNFSWPSTSRHSEYLHLGGFQGTEEQMFSWLVYFQKAMTLLSYICITLLERLILEFWGQWPGPDDCYDITSNNTSDFMYHLFNPILFWYRNSEGITVNFTYNEQAYKEILLVMKSNESPGRSPISLHWVMYVCNKFVYNELSAFTKPSRGPIVIVASIFLPIVTKCFTGIPN